MLPVSGYENHSAYNQSEIGNQTAFPGTDQGAQRNGVSSLQNILASFILPNNSQPVILENLSETPVLPGQTLRPDQGEANHTQPPHTMPMLEIGSAYVIFLLTFGISVLVLAILTRMGRKISATYEIRCRRRTSLILAAGYLLLGLIAGFISIPVLSIFSASILTGNQFWPGGAVAFFMVYLFLSSFILSYSLFNRSPFVLVQAVHPIPAAALLAIFWYVDQSLPDFNGKELVLPLTLLLSLVLPTAHWRCLKKHTGNTIYQETDPSSSSPTLINGETGTAVRILNGFPSELEERYADAELVGRGGMALVFRVRRRSDGETVAVKVPTRYDEVTGHCFMREMQIWKGLSHKNIVTVYTYNILPVPFVEMEFVGPSLAQTEKPLQAERAVFIIRGIAEGLAYAHATGVIHRDVKPENILIAPDGTPKITDWGLSKEMTDRRETQFVAFSLDYATPEQISPSTYGRGDARTDIFQLGVVFYELLTGTLPFTGEGMGEMSVAILTEHPLPPSEINGTLRPFDRIIEKCLEKKPDLRYSSIDEFLRDLDAVMNI